jgi:hypothetical protein
MSDLIEIDTSDDIFGWEFCEFEQVRMTLGLLGFTNYFAAGGYFRDKRLGKDWKDIDLFVPGKEGTEDLGNEYDLSSAHEFILDGIRVNIIFMGGPHDMKSVLERMDIGLCQIGYHNGKLLCTQGYLDDVKNKTITWLTPSDNRGHLNRIMEKYCDFKLVDG